MIILNFEILNFNSQIFKYLNFTLKVIFNLIALKLNNQHLNFKIAKHKLKINKKYFCSSDMKINLSAVSGFFKQKKVCPFIYKQIYHYKNK